MTDQIPFYTPFLKRLHLFNFMLHENTELIFKHPILIISGANGSGKTQIVEAIILAFGEKLGRTKKGLSTLIGQFDNQAIVELEINNIRSDGSPIFQSTDINLQPYLQKPIIHLRLIITTQKLIRYLGIGNKHPYQQVTQRQIKSLMRSAGIRPANQLTFTMGETVDIFANQTPYRKFQVLLENLGLSDLRAEIIQNEKSIKAAVNDTARLQRKIEEEEHNLEIFLSMIETIQNSSKLESLLESLSI